MTLLASEQMPNDNSKKNDRAVGEKTEEQAKALAEAKRSLEAAQAVIAELEELQRPLRIPRWKAMRKQRASEKTPECGTAGDAGATSELPLDRHLQVETVRSGVRPRMRNKHVGKLPAPQEAREAYLATQSFSAFVCTFALGHHDAIKALAKAGINIYEDVGLAWDNGKSFRELSAQHGVTRGTISRWVKKT